MRRKTAEVARQIESALIDVQYAQAAVLGKKLHLSKGQVYKGIKYLRLMGTGVYPDFRGYTLSEHATKKDDVRFIRRLYGRRTSDYISLKAAEGDILRRWHTVEDRRELKLLVAPISTDVSKSKGMQILLSKNGLTPIHTK